MGIVTIDRSANKMYTHALLVLAMALAAECAPERAYGYGHHETTTTTMKPEPYKKHDNTFYHRPSYKSYNGYNSYHHNEYSNYHHMEPRMYSPYHSYQTYASPVYHTSYGYHNLHKRSPTFGNVQIDLPTAALIKAAAVAGAGKGLLLASTIPAGTFTVAGTALALGR